MYKRIDFTQLEGIAVYQDTMDFLQTSYRGAFEGLARAIGSNVIVSGVADEGANWGDGWVCIDGELMPFVGGLKAAQIITEELTDTEVYADDSVKTAYFTKRAKLGSAGGTNFTDFVRLTEFKTISTTLTALIAQVAALAVVPTGMIAMWSGTVPPTGWALCDGSGGRPNLRGRFIVGYNASDADYNAIGKIGGQKTVTLTVNEIPSHNHYVKEVITSGDENTGDPDDHSVGAWNESGTTKNTSSTGGGLPHENRPPYYTLAYIIKL